jgi:hypothetical protein
VGKIQLIEIGEFLQIFMTNRLQTAVSKFQSVQVGVFSEIQLSRDGIHVDEEVHHFHVVVAHVWLMWAITISPEFLISFNLIYVASVVSSMLVVTKSALHSHFDRQPISSN